MSTKALRTLLDRVVGDARKILAEPGRPNNGRSHAKSMAYQRDLLLIEPLARSPK